MYLELEGPWGLILIKERFFNGKLAIHWAKKAFDRAPSWRGSYLSEHLLRKPSPYSIYGSRFVLARYSCA